jgi:hypothetical protein
VVAGCWVQDWVFPIFNRRLRIKTLLLPGRLVLVPENEDEQIALRPWKARHTNFVFAERPTPTGVRGAVKRQAIAVISTWGLQRPRCSSRGSSAGPANGSDARCSRACPADGLCLTLYRLKAPIFRAFRSELVMQVGVLIALLRGSLCPFSLRFPEFSSLSCQDDAG